MKKRIICVIALLTALCLLFSGCSLDIPSSIKAMLSQYVPVSFSEMEYTRPDIDALERALEDTIACATEDDFSELERALMNYSYLYRSYSTNYALATIYYYTDMTDIYWTDEYNACLGMSSQADGGLDRLMYALADSPHRETLETDEYYGEGYFDDYEGESLWDETFTALMDEEAEILSEYYLLAAEWNFASDENAYAAYAQKMCENYVRLAAKRKEIAECAGYDSYEEFAFVHSYARDYTTEQVENYFAQVQSELVPLYRNLLTNGISDVYLSEQTEKETFSYVEKMASAMGGTIQEAFELLRECGLYDISYGENKYDASFEIYLSEYDEPYVFLNPTGSDQDSLTFAHEFGHFCNDYASYGSVSNVDVAETFSQAMEYLSLFYAENTEMLQKIKMIDSLCVYVEQSAYADFEHRIYALDAKDLTTQRVYEIYSQINADYGFDLYGATETDFIYIPHLYMSPCYVFSYVVSNDVAMQFYEMEAAQSGSGLSCYLSQLDTMAISLTEFIEEAQLENPLEENRLETVRTLFEAILA